MAAAPEPVNPTMAHLLQESAGRCEMATEAPSELALTSTAAALRRWLLAWYDRERRDLPWRAKPGETSCLNAAVTS